MKKPAKINTLRDLMNAADKRQSVFAPTYRCFVWPRPAAFCIHLTGYVLVNMLESGMYVYTPKPKVKHNYKRPAKLTEVPF